MRIDTRWATAGDAESTQRFAKELVALAARRHLAQQHTHRGRVAAGKPAPSPSFS